MNDRGIKYSYSDITFLCMCIADIDGYQKLAFEDF